MVGHDTAQGKGDGTVGATLSLRRAPPPVTAERLARGKQLYADAECLKCHGATGRRDGTPPDEQLKDHLGFPIIATDLTKSARFKNGSRPEDVYRTLMTGLLGTPMPSYGDSLEPDQAWDLVYYGPVAVARRRSGRGGDTVKRILLVAVVMIFAVGLAAADEAPISRTVKSVDTAAQTVTLATTAKGEGDKEVAEVVKVVLER